MGVPTTDLNDAPARDPSGRAWTDGVRPALIGWLWARACVAAGFAVAHLLSGRVTMPDGRLHLTEGLLTWDAGFYRVLATGWYRGAPAEGARFFPLYPAVGRVLGPVFLGREDIALVVVANAGALVGAVVLWHLARTVIGGREVADRSAWMLALVPSAFVLAFGYSEGVGVLLVAATLLSVHRRWWGRAALTALAAAAIRPVGVLLVVPIAVEAFRAPQPRRAPRTGFVLRGWGDRPIHAAQSGSMARRVAAVLAPLVGLAAAVLWVGSSTGDLGRPLRIQRQLRDGFRDPFTRLVQGLWDVARLELRDVYSVAFAVVFIGLLAVSVRRRQPWSWIAYSAATLGVALSANNIDSLGRYGLLALPLVVALAQWSDRRWRQVAVATIGSVGLVWLTAAALLGRMIP